MICLPYYILFGAVETVLLIYFNKFAIVMSMVAMDAVLDPMVTISAVVIFFVAGFVGTMISHPGIGLVL